MKNITLKSTDSVSDLGIILDYELKYQPSHEPNDKRAVRAALAHRPLPHMFRAQPK